MSGPPYMKFYFADYANDTTHLTTAREHGAYFLLIKAMWSAGGKLPADDKRLAALALCKPEEWAEIRETILPFFKRRGGIIRHKRIDAEMAVYQLRSVQASRAGKSSASKRANKNKDKASTDVQRNSTISETEPDSRTEPLQGSGSTSDASEPARPEGAVSSRPTLTLVEKESIEVRRAAIAEAMGRVVKPVADPPAESPAQMAERLRKAL